MFFMGMHSVMVDIWHNGFFCCKLQKKMTEDQKNVKMVIIKNKSSGNYNI